MSFPPNRWLSDAEREQRRRVSRQRDGAAAPASIRRTHGRVFKILRAMAGSVRGQSRQKKSDYTTIKTKSLWHEEDHAKPVVRNAAAPAMSIEYHAEEYDYNATMHQPANAPAKRNSEHSPMRTMSELPGNETRPMVFQNTPGAKTRTYCEVLNPDIRRRSRARFRKRRACPRKATHATVHEKTEEV